MPPFTYITGVGGSRNEILGSIQAKVELGEFKAVFSMQILHNLSYDAIFGRDFMDEFVEMVNVKTRRMTLINDGHTPCAAGEIGEWCAAGLVRGTTIYPGTRRVVQVYPTANILAQWLEIKGTKLNRVQGVTVHPGKVEGTSGSMECVLENCSDRTIRLGPDTWVAKLRKCRRETAAQAPGGSVNVTELAQHGSHTIPHVPQVPRVPEVPHVPQEHSVPNSVGRQVPRQGPGGSGNVTELAQQGSHAVTLVPQVPLEVPNRASQTATHQVPYSEDSLSRCWPCRFFRGGKKGKRLAKTPGIPQIKEEVERATRDQAVELEVTRGKQESQETYPGGP